MTYRTVSLLLIAALLAACGKDDRERLFDMAYPAIDFDIPAGLGASLPRVFEREKVSSNIERFLAQNNTDTSQFTAIVPVSARITALDNLDYEFVEEVSVRICPTGSEQCTLAEEVFYIDDLRGRAGQVIELLPSLGNAKRVLTSNSFRLEVVFFFRYTTPYTVRSRLDMSFRAVR